MGVKPPVVAHYSTLQKFSARSPGGMIPAVQPNFCRPASQALRWILQHEGVTATIPGARTPGQARANAAAGDLAPLPPEAMARVAELYETRVKPLVHQRW